MQADTIITRCRNDLKDTTPTYHWSDPTMYQYLSAGERLILERFPELRFDSKYNLKDFVVYTTDAELILDESYESALVFYINSRCLMEDGNDLADLGRAEDYDNKFKKLIYGG